MLLCMCCEYIRSNTPDLAAILPRHDDIVLSPIMGLHLSADNFTWLLPVWL